MCVLVLAVYLKEYINLRVLYTICGNVLKHLQLPISSIKRHKIVWCAFAFGEHLSLH